MEIPTRQSSGSHSMDSPCTDPTDLSTPMALETGYEWKAATNSSQDSGPVQVVRTMVLMSRITSLCQDWGS